MDFDLHPTVSLKERSFNVLVAPKEHFIEMLNRNLNLQLFVTGNFSGILSRLHRRFTELEIRRGFTTFQLMTIREEAYHSLIIIEHDLMLYEDSTEMVEYISQAMKQASHEATVLLYLPSIDPFLEDLAKGVDRVFYFTLKRGQEITEADCQDVADSPQPTVDSFRINIWVESKQCGSGNI
jgi:DNA polymerase I